MRVDHANRVSIITLDRPEKLNAIDSATLHDLDAVMTELGADSGVGAVVITGEGKAFSAGADIAAMSSFDGPHDFSAYIELMTDVYEHIERLPKPTIAAINGVALGGGFELALACDLRVMADTARVGLPEVKLGLLPGGGGTQRLSRAVPVAVAKRMLMTGDPIGADEAHRFGLVNEVAPVEAVVNRAVELASQLADGPALALAAAKRLVDNGRAMPLSGAIVYERETVSMLFGSGDGIEGVRAFVDKRPAKFQGR
jgi:enoyl-CoA hydratase